MDECLKVEEVCLIVSQTREKKNSVVKKIYYKKCAYLMEVIRQDFDQCEL